MNVERDTDRQLRAWVNAGVDRAPERFVWAALDEMDQVPQRAAWRARLESLGVRLRPLAGLAGAATVVLVAVAVLTRVAGPNLGPGGTRSFSMADLPGIVLWADTKPSSWTLDNLVSNPHDILVIPIRSMTETERDNLREPDGYVWGRYTDFSGPNAVFMSWATLFETDADAAAALPIYQHEMESADAWGFGRGQPIDFGSGGFLYAGETTAFTGPPGTNEPIRSQVYLWRDRNLLLAFGGWFDFEPDEVRTVAQGMDARAEAAAPIR